MGQKSTQLDDSITIPVTGRFKELMETLAKNDERNLSQFCRLLLQRAVAEVAVDQGLQKEAIDAGLKLPVSA